MYKRQVFSFALEPITSFISTISHGNVAREVANAHTLIKVVEVLLLFPFVKQIVKLTGLFVREEEKAPAQEFQLQYIGEKSVFSPTTAVFDATREMERMGNIAINNLKASMDALFTPVSYTHLDVYKRQVMQRYVSFSRPPALELLQEAMCLTVSSRETARFVSQERASRSLKASWHL